MQGYLKNSPLISNKLTFNFLVLFDSKKLTFNFVALWKSKQFTFNLKVDCLDFQKSNLVTQNESNRCLQDLTPGPVELEKLSLTKSNPTH